MTNIQPENYLNTNQLMQVSEKLKGVSEENSASLFNEVKILDENTNKVIDSGESAVSKIVNLGNRILNKLANAFGISVGTPENSSMEDFQDAQNDSVLGDYFTPYIKAGQESTGSDNLKEGILDDMITAENIQYTFEAIKEEKLSQGIKILEENDNYIKFEDGSELRLSESEQGFMRLEYHRTANDGSTSHGRIENYDDNRNQSNYTIATRSVDGNGPSEELYDYLLENHSTSKDYGEPFGVLHEFTEEGMQVFREHSNEESYSEEFHHSADKHLFGDNKDISRRADYTKYHTKDNHGHYNSETESKNSDYHISERHNW